MKQFLIRLEKSRTFWTLLGLSVLFFFLRLPSLIEPYWYGDEGIYQTIGLALSEGRHLYTEIWDNKTPLLYALYALFGPEQENMRFLSLLFGIASIPAFFYVSRQIFSKTATVLTVTGVFTVLFGLPFLEGNIANAENFLLLPVLVGVGLFLHALKVTEHHNPNLRLFFFSGLMLGTAFLFKTVAIFDVASLLFFYLCITLPHNFHLRILKKYLQFRRDLFLSFLSGFFLPIALSLVYFFFRGSLFAYIQAAFFGNVDYVGVQNSGMILLTKIILLCVGLVVLLRNRAKLNPPLLFVSIWFLFSLFNSFFTQRPYTHYLLVLLPSFSLLAGFLKSKNAILRRTAFGVLVVTTVLTLTFFNNWNLLKSFSYYGNFLFYIIGQKSSDDYASFFDPRTPRDQDIAAYLKKQLKPKETVFFWGDNGQMYYLTRTLPPGRYIVAYHISHASHALEETKKAFQNVKPTYVVIFPEVPTSPFPLYNYQQRLSIEGAIVYERIY